MNREGALETASSSASAVAVVQQHEGLLRECRDVMQHVVNARKSCIGYYEVYTPQLETTNSEKLLAKLDAALASAPEGHGAAPGQEEA